MIQHDTLYTVTPSAVIPICCLTSGTPPIPASYHHQVLLIWPNNPGPLPDLRAALWPCTNKHYVRRCEAPVTDWDRPRCQLKRH